MNKGNIITARRLRELFDFDPNTGSWTRIFSHHANAKKGVFVPCDDGSGYAVMRVDGYKYHSHRLAWLYVHGSWPKGHIDHINGNRGDNRIENLRDVSMDINAQNLRGAQKNNSCGVLGVTRRGNRFIAQITIKKQNRYLGMFDSAELAHAAYLESKRKYHEGNTL